MRDVARAMATTVLVVGGASIAQAGVVFSDNFNSYGYQLN